MSQVADAASQQVAYYREITDTTMSGLENFRVVDFIPCPGTILIVLPPVSDTTEGGIIKGASMLKDSSVGRVAAVPQDDPTCPVELGDWVVSRFMEGHEVAFDGRTDLRLLHYCDGPDSDVVGIFPASAVPDECSVAEQTTSVVL